MCFIKNLISDRAQKIIYSGLCFGIPKLLQVSHLIYFTNYLTLNEYGKFSLILITIDFIQGIFFTWIKMGYIRFYDVSNIEIGGISFQFIFTLTMLFISLFLILSQYPAYNFFENNLFNLGVMIAIFARGYNAIILDMQRISNKTLTKYFYTALITDFIYYGIPIFLCYFLKIRNIGMIILITSTALLLWILAVLLPRYNISIKKIVKIHSKQNYIIVLKFGLPLIAVFIFANAFTRIDRYLIENQLGLEVLGIYSAAFSLSTLLIGSVFAILSLPYFPEIIRNINQSNISKAKDLYQEYGIYLFMSLIVISIATIVLKGNLCDFFFGEKSEKILNVFPWVFFSVLVYNLKVHFFDQIFIFLKKTKTAMKLSGFTATVYIFLSFLFINDFGVFTVPFVSSIVCVSAIIYTIISEASFLKK